MSKTSVIEPLQHIPTNIITGFLGVGKTTAILHLLAQKLADERWAVLVNEFGEVGIDGALLAGSQGEEKGVFVREVPGGCMCCAAGLPMQIALNMLLARARPDRLLIEPTGLGHPREVLQTLQGDAYRDLLDLQTVVTLVDARNIQQTRYTEHDTFNQQLQIADLVVANKCDLYQQDELQQLRDYLDATESTRSHPIEGVEQGHIPPSWLTQASRHHGGVNPVTPAAPAPQPLLPLGVSLFPPEGFMQFANAGEGFYSHGWIFKPQFQFNKARLDVLLSGINAERIKAVLNTDEGLVGYNHSAGVLSETSLQSVNDNRVEMISQVPLDTQAVEQALLDAVVQRP